MMKIFYCWRSWGAGTNSVQLPIFTFRKNPLCEMSISLSDSDEFSQLSIKISHNEKQVADAVIQTSFSQEKWVNSGLILSLIFQINYYRLQDVVQRGKMQIKLLFPCIYFVMDSDGHCKVLFCGAVDFYPNIYVCIYI